ncbi:MAG: hypothetical protein IMZ71_01375 [Chloroflexi bacterium]|nr:hypothetical protein [Chloroflexota bacterium]
MDERAKSYAEMAAEYFTANPNGPVPAGMFGPPVVDPELPPFWKPEVVGDRRLGEVRAVRPTKDFGEGRERGEAIHLVGPDTGVFSIPIGANLKLYDWKKQVGRTFLFEFAGWQNLEDDMRCRKWIVLPLKADPAPQDEEDVAF